jgi:uncharacterized membrane protein HdeD (DUF308 family)
MNGAEHHFATILSRGWWLLLLRGLAAIASGILTSTRPGVSLAALVLLFGIYSIADGALDAWAAMVGREEQEDWWVLFLGGLLGIGIGVLTLSNPGLTALALMYYIATWAIARGALGTLAAIRSPAAMR